MTFGRAFIIMAGLLAPLPSVAAVITTGFTFAVASGTDTNVGNHLHSSSGGVFGNPAGKAEVGRYSSEAVRGLSEYNLAGLTTATSAFVTFDVYRLGGLFNGTNDFPFNGTIAVDAYSGNNTENITDYQALSIGAVGSFSTTALAVGDVLSLDITSIYNAAILGGQSSLGLRLAGSPLPASGALTFDTFRLTTDNQSTTPTDVPEPMSALLLATGCLIAWKGRQRA